MKSHAIVWLTLLLIGCQNAELKHRLEPLTDLEGDEIKPRISPNGEYLAFQRIYEGQSDIMIQHLASGEIIPLAYSNENESTPTWSPDSKEIIYARTEEGSYGLFKMHIESKVEREVFLSDTLQLSAADWSPDGKRIVATGLFENKYFQWVLDLVTGDITKVTQKGDEYNGRWLQNNQEVIYYTGRNDSIMIVNVDNGIAQCVSRGEYTGYYPHAAPDNNRFIFTSHIGGSQNIWLSDRTGQIMTNLTNEEFNYFPSWYPNGNSIVMSRRVEDEQVYVLNIHNQAYKQLTAGNNHKWPSVSPSGTVALIQIDDQSKKQFISLLEENTVRKIPEAFTFIEYMDWSDDGSYLVFTGTKSPDIQPDQSLSIYLLDVRQSVFTEILEAGRTRNPVWIDGTHTFVYSRRDHRQKLVINRVDVTTKKEELLLEMDHSAFATDYHAKTKEVLLFTRVNYGDFKMYTYHLETKKITQILQTEHTPTEGRFSPDGGSILYSVRDGNQFDLKLLDLKTRQSRTLTSDVYRESPADWLSDSLVIFSVNKNDLNLWKLDL